MTFISRRTRIIVPRWLDECDANYAIKRTRSDGRLKKHSSCDDLRAWVNNYCIRHDYFVDLMSDGEANVKSNVRLYGRFIPVPVLVEVLQNQKSLNVEGNFEGKSETKSGTKLDTQSKTISVTKSNTISGHVYGAKLGAESESKPEFGNSDKDKEKSEDTETQDDEDEDVFIAARNASLQRLQCEKLMLEKNLYEFTRLLCQSIRKLEKIGKMVSAANNDAESARSEEIREAFAKSCHSCVCTKSNTCKTPNQSNQRIREAGKCKELLRKISCLLEKLKKIEERRQDLDREMQSFHEDNETGTNLQVTELYCREEQSHRKMLQKKLERLRMEKGRLLREMVRALNCLNSLKKASRSNTNFSGIKSTGSFEDNDEGFRECCFQEEDKTNVCDCCENHDSSEDGEVSQVSSVLGEDGFQKNESYAKSQSGFRNYSSKNLENVNKSESGRTYEIKNDQVNSTPTKQISNQSTSQKSQFMSASAPGFSKTEEITKEPKKTSLKFVCPQPSCKKRSYLDNLTAFQNSVGWQQKTSPYIGYNYIVQRPKTSPGVVSEQPIEEKNPTRSKVNIPERRMKSETTMKEIEKALRNYEQRLKKQEGLECKIEGLKQKLREAYWLKQQWVKLKAEDKKLRESSLNEIQKLCSENWDLRKQVQQLTTKFEMQCRRVENLKHNTDKLKEIQGEAEEVKKELKEYQEGYEDQRIYISKLENVVTSQRTEIEKLMNDIKKLTKVNDNDMCGPYQDKKNVQRSRSYSPDWIRTKKVTVKQKPQGPRYRGEEDEEGSCWCEDSRRRIQQRGFYTPQPPRRPEMCMN